MFWLKLSMTFHIFTIFSNNNKFVLHQKRLQGITKMNQPTVSFINLIEAGNEVEKKEKLDVIMI